MVSDPRLEYVEELKQAGSLDEALEKVNELLAQNPMNKAALYQVADIEYRKGELGRAEKPVDFLLGDNEDDAMGLYIKGVLAMEKTDWKEAKKIFKRILRLVEEENPEIMRCLGLSEYWSGNREVGIRQLEEAHKATPNDAEIIINLVELMIMEEEWDDAKRYVNHYRSLEKVECLDREQSYYDDKIVLFETYLQSPLLMSERDGSDME